MGQPKRAPKTEQEKALEEVSIAQWNDYVARFVPAEAALAKKAELTAGERARVKGEVSADVADAFKDLPRETLAAHRGDASSGGAKAALAGDALAAGKAKGLGKAAAETVAEVEELKQRTGITALGRNVAADTTADLSRGARRAGSVAITEARARNYVNQAKIGLAASIAGAGIRKYQAVQADKLDAANNARISGLLPPIEPSLPTQEQSAFFKGYNPLSKWDPFAGGDD